jgi:flavin-dependent dehydrogenase
MGRYAIVAGGGIAGLSCARLLARHGWEIEVWCGATRALPAFVINATTQCLMRDIWQADDDLFAGAHPLNGRLVWWGTVGNGNPVGEPALTMRGEVLVDRLLSRLVRESRGRVRVFTQTLTPEEAIRRAGDEGWLVEATGRTGALATAHGLATRYPVGRRRAIGVQARLTAAASRDLSAIETVERGWLFFAPLSSDHALIQAMVPATTHEPEAVLREILHQTRRIACWVGELVTAARFFNAAPEMLSPLCGDRWIAVGEAAVALDPLCGDGTGYAARSAILAAAVMEAVSSQEPAACCLGHYDQRLSRAFEHHLVECLRFYTVAFDRSREWVEELRSMRTFSVSHASSRSQIVRPLYSLESFSLKRLM